MIGQTAHTTLSIARSWHDEKEHRAKLADAVNQILKGKVNCTGSLTLTSSTAVTTLTDPRIGHSSFIGFMPESSTAATYPLHVSSRGDGTATVGHVSTALTDLTYTYAVLG